MGLPGGNPVVVRVFAVTLCFTLGNGTLFAVLVLMHELRRDSDP